MTSSTRIDGRLYNQLRPVRVSYDVYGYAAASVLFELGNTKVLCSVHVQTHVPFFLKGTKTGWLTAEYAMLPGSTMVRTQRDDGSKKKDGRAVEISRLIGRSLRSIVNLKPLGEQTIVIDCDVLQADGGTRTAAITGACLALERAQERWLAAGVISAPLLTDSILAISVGLQGEVALLDPNYEEDAQLNADFNFVLTKTGDVVEIQGTAERKPVAWHHMTAMCTLAR
ncbi:MAG TPA: ribonuclease PH, partial [Candidatus Limnocylindria bacterium]|nr:ribonuclease PH [Candidatus Limnocylindria bacterium]